MGTILSVGWLRVEPDKRLGRNCNLMAVTTLRMNLYFGNVGCDGHAKTRFATRLQPVDNAHSAWLAKTPAGPSRAFRKISLLKSIGVCLE